VSWLELLPYFLRKIQILHGKMSLMSSFKPLGHSVKVVGARMGLDCGLVTILGLDLSTLTKLLIF